jgi:hypothetical protein
VNVKDAPRSGVVTISVWTEGLDGAWRARITGLLDVRVPATEELAAASVEDVCRALKEWFQAFQEGRSRVGWGARDEPGDPVTGR